LITYHDPNFGVKFDQIVETMRTVPKADRNPYVMESSLSILEGPRMQLLEETNCVFVAIGLESWTNYSNKAGIKSNIADDKLEKVVVHIKELHRYVQSIQINFLFGTDMDKGHEPVELTKEFIRELPFVWPVINMPIPFGGTPLYESYLADGRILKAMPFSFYFAPYLATIPKNYHPLEYYDNWIEILKLATSAKISTQRISSSRSRLQKFLHVIRTMSVGKELSRLYRIRKLLRSETEIRVFHEGRSSKLPEFYRRLYKNKLGRYAELITEAEMSPELEPWSISSDH
jgi:hypothetical protein